MLTAGLPVTLVLVLRATGVLDSMRVPRRRSRLILMAIAILMEFAVLAVYLTRDAPTTLIQAQVALITGLTTVGLLTMFLRASVHCAAISVMVVTLMGVGGPGYAVLLLLVPLVGWSRVRVSEHTKWQVVTGSILPGLVAGIALML